MQEQLGNDVVKTILLYFLENGWLVYKNGKLVQTGYSWSPALIQHLIN